MAQVRFCGVFRIALVLAAAGWALSSPADSQLKVAFNVLHSFGAPGDGTAPAGGLVLDGKGNLYGVTNGGGSHQGDQSGTVFELMPGANDQWTETILYNFPGGPTDGFAPAGVVIDKSGNLFGTTTYGGTNAVGTIFELTPGANGQWTESVLWNCSLPDCSLPLYPPTLGPGGVLYGFDGDNVYALTPGADGWTFAVLYTFCSLPNCTDGEDALGSPSLDANGTLYGETWEGGTSDGGVVFVLHPEHSVPWKETVLHDFNVEDGGEGYDLSGGVTLHGRGLYATTQAGGIGCDEAGCGTVFDLTRQSGNNINEQVLHAFGASGTHGITPLLGVTFNAQGDLFGVTLRGGNPNFCGDGCGTVYGMKPGNNGQWAFAVLHEFVNSDGVEPDSGLAIDNRGNLYGETAGGGQYYVGVAFELSPMTQASK